LAETTYHKEKLYVPREVQEKLGLVDGDKLEIEVVDKSKALIRVLRSKEAAKKALEWLRNPPDLGEVKGRLTRKEIYEDHP